MKPSGKGFTKWSDLKLNGFSEVGIPKNSSVDKPCKALTSLEKSVKETTKKIAGKEIVAPKEEGIKFKNRITDINTILSKGMSYSKDYKKAHAKISDAIRILDNTASNHGQKKNSFNCNTPKFQSTVDECVDAISIFVRAFEKFDNEKSEEKKKSNEEYRIRIVFNVLFNKRK